MGNQQTVSLPAAASPAFLAAARRAVAILRVRVAPAGLADVEVVEGVTDGYTAVLQACIPFRPLTAV